MRLAVTWLPVLALLPACLDGGLDAGACNENHVCEPDESYDVCPQDCYWHPDGAEVLGKLLPRALMTALPGMAPAPGEFYERAGNGVCELRESWRFSPDCSATCGDGVDDPDERATCMADTTLARAQTECNSNGLCEYQDDATLAAMLTGAPKETPWNCPLDCTPMGPDPVLNVFIDSAQNNKSCDRHENHSNGPDECAPGCHDGCCAPGEDSGPCPEDCTLVDDPVACPCISGDCLKNCGDGVLDPGEQCDDGNAVNTDTCTSACNPATCGDGYIQPGEQCDDGNTADDDGCTKDCAPPTSCGDGFVDQGEQCDDGNTDPTDACTAVCKPATCGDGYVQTGVEDCDDGPDNADTAACTSQCVAATCGDLLVQAGVETCDDGNPDNTDDCTDDCQVAACGDGHLHADVEACDDGNAIDTDACSNDCQPPRTVFIMFPGEGVGGNLGGILGADFMCKTAATNAALAGTYKAWLTDSDATTAPATRFASADFTGWYLGTDGTPIAHGWADLTTLEDNDVDYLKAPIRFDQNGSDINVETTAWTNTGPDGEQDPMNKHCANWTSGLFALSGSFGLSSATTLNADWTLAGTLPCTSDVRLYCFQTAP